ncbi:MAG: ferredoxin, partial [Hyphomicrobiales bacterium]|nr:ferredoxin [Hyphomicrobiales bacterium]
MTTPRTIRFTLNGRSVSLDVIPHETIIDMLTLRFDLKGARESCGQGL